jgi:hypothetical protein
MAHRRPIRAKEILSPDRIFNNLLKDYVDGNLDDYDFLYRASVVSIDMVGGQFEQDPPNPKNSIRARVITNGRDRDLDPEDLPVFWPIFTHDIFPAKEGEHIYVIFEDAGRKSHGLWLCRVSEPNNVDNKNYVQGIKKYQDDPNNEFSSVGIEQAVQDTNSELSSISVSPEFEIEEGLPFVARVGDRVIEGSNDSMIVLGRDRPSDIGSGQRQRAGTIDIVTGRSVQDNMDLSSDKSRIYVTANSDVDGNFSINVGESSGPSASIGIKSDQIRIIARNGMKLVVEGGNIYIDAQEIFLGSNAQEQAVLGNKLVGELTKIIDAISTGPVGALGSIPIPSNPVLVTNLNTIKSLISQNILSRKNKIE